MPRPLTPRSFDPLGLFAAAVVLLVLLALFRLPSCSRSVTDMRHVLACLLVLALFTGAAAAVSGCKGVSVEPVTPDPGARVAAKICATVEASAAPSGAPAVGK